MGLGHKQSIANAQKIKYLDPHEGDHVISISGGEHHSMVLFKSGCIYCFGRNDEGQIGIGDLFGDYKRKKVQEAAEKAQKEEEERIAKEKKEQEEAEQMKVDQQNEAEKPAEDAEKPAAEGQEGEASKPEDAAATEAPKESGQIEEKPQEPVA